MLLSHWAECSFGVPLGHGRPHDPPPPTTPPRRLPPDTAKHTHVPREGQNQDLGNVVEIRVCYFVLCDLS